jgi:predicted chitinase
LTGKYNYQALANEIGDEKIMEGADYVSRNYAWTSAGFWWENNNMNSLVDSGASEERISTRVNGRNPANGLADRKRYYNLARKIFN